MTQPENYTLRKHKIICLTLLPVPEAQPRATPHQGLSGLRKTPLGTALSNHYKQEGEQGSQPTAGVPEPGRGPSLPGPGQAHGAASVRRQSSSELARQDLHSSLLGRGADSASGALGSPKASHLRKRNPVPLSLTEST